MQLRICACTVAAVGIGSWLWLSTARQSQVDAAPPPASESIQARPAPVDNEQCLQCHQNLTEDSFTGRHAKEKVTCAQCHGPSRAHMADAAAGVRADVSFGRAEVDRFCKQCHKEPIHKDQKELDQFVSQWQGKRRPNGRKIAADSICTDCHGEHAMPRHATTQPAAVELFNGRDLSGWQTVGNARWSVEDGLLVGVQGADGAAGDLLSEQSYKDFELTVVYQVDWPANSGIWFRYQNPETSYQADILEYKNPEAYSGTIYCPGKLFIARNLDPKLENKTRFNTMKIRAEGDHLQVWLNGRQVGDVRDDTIKSGKIGFQVHAGDEFKNMKLAVQKVTLTDLSR